MSRDTESKLVDILMDLVGASSGCGCCGLSVAEEQEIADDALTGIREVLNV